MQLGEHFSRVVVRNSMFGVGAQLAIKLLSFAFSVLVVRHLGADSFGQYSAVLAFGAMFVFLGDLGLSPYSVRQVARWRDLSGSLENTKRLYGNVLGLRLLLSLLAAVLLIAAAVVTERPPAMVGAIALGAIGLIMYAVQGASDSLLMGFERFDISSAARVSNQVAFVIVGGAALWLGLGYYGVVFANLIGVALMTYLCWRGVKGLGLAPRAPDRAVWTGLLRASMPFGVIGFTLGLSYRFDSVLLNIFRGDAETGYYNAAYNLVFSAAILSNAFNIALYPALARQAAVDPSKLPRVYERALGYLIMLAFPIAAGGWALADRLIPFLFTAAYLPSVLALQVVIWAVPLMFASEFLGYVVVVRGAEMQVARAVVVSTGLNVTLNLLLVPRFGFLGAAVMTVLTEMVLVGQYGWMLRGLVRDFDWTRLLLKPALGSSLMVGVVLLLHGLPLPAVILTGGAAYLLFLALSGTIGTEEMSLIRGLVRERGMPFAAGDPKEDIPASETGGAATAPARVSESEGG